MRASEPLQDDQSTIMVPFEPSRRGSSVSPRPSGSSVHEHSPAGSLSGNDAGRHDQGAAETRRALAAPLSRASSTPSSTPSTSPSSRACGTASLPRPRRSCCSRPSSARSAPSTGSASSRPISAPPTTGKLTLATLPALAFGLMPPCSKSTAPSTLARTSPLRSRPPRASRTRGRTDDRPRLCELPLARGGRRRRGFLLRAPLMLAVPCDHPLARHAEVTPQDLIGEPLIALPQTSLSPPAPRPGLRPSRPELQPGPGSAIRTAGCNPHRAWPRDRSSRPFTASAFDSRSLVQVPFRPAIPFEIAVLHPTQRPLSRAARSFLAMCARERNRILEAQQAPGPDQT